METQQTNEIQNETTTTTAPKSKEPKGPPAWQTFMDGKLEKISQLGLEVEVQKNFVQVLHAETDQRIYVAKEARKVTHVFTTMPCAGDINGATKFEGSNGKIEAELSLDAFDLALEALAAARYGKVRASKRQAKAVAPVQPTATPMSQVADPLPEEESEDSELIDA